MSCEKVAVVTGANKGVGKAIVRALCKQFKGKVILTARDEGRGVAAVKELENEGLSPLFHELDITNSQSADKLRDHLKEKYGGLDVLVNNAAILYKASSTAPFSEQAEVTNDVNFFGTLNVCRALFPILKPHARVVHVSSGMSTIALGRCSEEIKKRWLTTSSVQQCEDLVKEFVRDAKAGVHQKDGWPNSAYGVSKLGVTAMTPCQQAELDNDPREDMIVNSCCPGYVDTDMTSHKGVKTPDQGAETPVYLALIAENATSPRGEFLSELQVVNWKQGEGITS